MISFDGAIAEAIQRAEARGREDVTKLPLRALALHAFRVSPTAAVQLWGTGRPLALCLDDLVHHPAFGRGPQHDGTHAQRAFAALLDGPALPVPSTGDDTRPVAFTRFTVEHGLGSLLGRPMYQLVHDVLGSEALRALKGDRQRPLRAMIEQRHPLVVDILEAHASLAAAQRSAQWPPPVVADEPGGAGSGNYGGERARWCRAILAQLAEHGVSSAAAMLETFGSARIAVDRDGILYERHQAPYGACRVSVVDAGAGVSVQRGDARYGGAPRGDTAEARALEVAALSAAFNIVNEPPAGFDSAVARFFAPRHAELLAALQRLAAPRSAPEREERVVWVFEAMYGQAMVSPFVQKQKGKKGGFTKGTRIAPQAIVDGEHGATEQDRRAARIAAARGGVGDETCLRILAGHPLVFDEARDEPYAVRADTARVAVRDRADGYGVAIVAGDKDIDANLIRAAAETGVVVDVRPASRELVVIEVPRALQELAETVMHVNTIPASARGEVHALADAIVDDATIELAPSLRGEPIAADERVFVRLTRGADGALGVRIGHRPISNGGLFSPGEGPAEVSGLIVDAAGKRRVRSARDEDGERARAEAIRALLPLEGVEIVDDWTFTAPPAAPDAALALVERLQEVSASRDDVVVEWKEGTPRLQVMGRAASSALRLGVRSVHEWLAVEGEATVDEETLSLGVMLEAVRNGRRYVPVAPDRFVALADSLRERLKPLAAFAGDTAADANAPAGVEGGATPRLDGVHVAPSLASALDDLRDDGVRFDDTDAWRRIAERAKRARAANDEPPAALLADLRTYQREGVRFLRRLAAWETGGVLADDMGLGKTVQAIAHLIDRASAGPQLVLAPTSVCFNWQRELERFAPSLRVVSVHDATADERSAKIREARAGDVVVIGYALAVQCADAFLTVDESAGAGGTPKKTKKGKAKTQETTTFATVIFDEAQALKNAETQRARLARDINAEQKIALSGTPLENHLGELWSIFRVVSPGLLGSHERFRKRFALPIERDRSLKKRQELAQTLRPFLLRRTKNEVARELPARTEIVTTVELSPEERQLYDATRAAVLADVAADLDGASQDRRFRVLAGLTRLRLLACHPRLVDEESDASTSAKLTAVRRVIADLKDNGHRALVFSQFVKHLALVKRALEEDGVTVLQLDGSTPAREREKLVDAFQAGGATAFLLSLKAGGAGLNLTAADYVLHLDPWWNPAVEDQATGRAHRIGQTQPVTVYRFVARGTIEEQMLAMHADKRDLVDSVLEGADAAGKLSVDELIALVRA